MHIDLTNKEFRRLLDMVYLGNWVLNSTRGDDRFKDYDDLESKLRYLLETPAVLETFTATCAEVSFETPETYYQQMLSIYGDENENLRNWNRIYAHSGANGSCDGNRC